jgi:hypothetical protein
MDIGRVSLAVRSHRSRSDCVAVTRWANFPREMPRRDCPDRVLMYCSPWWVVIRMMLLNAMMMMRGERIELVWVGSCPCALLASTKLGPESACRAM